MQGIKARRGGRALGGAWLPQFGRKRQTAKCQPSAAGLRVAFASAVGAFTLVEMLIALACALFVLAALIAGEVTLLRTFDASDRYSASEMAAERVVDYLGADLRRAAWVTGTTGVALRFENPSSGARAPFISGSLTFVLGGTNLLITQCGYYRSNLTTDPGYRTAAPLISTDANNVIYGTTTGGSNAMVLVRYRLVYHPAYGSNCLVRDEAPVDIGAVPYSTRVIAEKVDNMLVSLAFSGTSNAPRNHPIVKTTAWFVPPYSQRGAVTATSYLSTGAVGRIITEDTVMLRNPQ